MAKSKRKPALQSVGLQPYRGTLSAKDCAAAMQAARLNARSLFETAQILFNKGRYAHSLVFSVIAIEESGKQLILKALFLGFDETDKAWGDYRSHTAKTALFNFAIEQRVLAEFPQVDATFAKRVAAAGPNSEDLDAAKQLTLYSDCFSSPEGPAVHLPTNIEWREKAEHLLVEAQILINYMRDYAPEELEVWHKHVSNARGQGLPGPTCSDRCTKNCSRRDSSRRSSGIQYCGTSATRHNPVHLNKSLHLQV